jgi:hypothetical protein
MADAAASAALLARITQAITDLADAQAAAANAAAAAAAAVPIGGQAPVVAAPTVFTLWPGLANNAALHYNTSCYACRLGGLKETDVAVLGRHCRYIIRTIINRKVK